MKLLVLGGCADMAHPLLKLAAADAAIERVSLADLNVAKARGIAAEYGPRFEGVACDANDAPAVVSLMRGHDVVVCYVGPFYVFEKKLAQCAIEAGVPYVSIAVLPDLHAKIFLCEAIPVGFGLVGSANLTAKSLTNFEIGVLFVFCISELGYWANSCRYFSTAWRILSSLSPRISAAKMAEFFAPDDPIATVATGMPV